MKHGLHNTFKYGFDNMNREATVRYIADCVLERCTSTTTDCHTAKLYSDEETRRQVCMYYIKKGGPKNDQELFQLMKLGLNTVIPYRRVCNNPDHSAPFKLFSDLYFSRCDSVCNISSRGSGKSRNLAYLAWLNSTFKPYCKTRILSSSGDQAERCYSGMTDLWDHSGIADIVLLKPPMKRKTEWRNRSLVEILTASTKSVRGPHSQILACDEVDEMEEDVFKSALSQPESKHGIPSTLIITSTHHREFGIMTDLRENKKDVYKFYYSCVFDVIQSCRDYSCSTCKLAAYCPGPVVKLATGFYSVDDVIKKFSILDDDTINSEYFCNKPSHAGRVYPDWDETNNVVPDLDYDTSKEVYLCIDFGSTADHPYVILAVQILKRAENNADMDKIGVIDEIYLYENATASKVKLELLKKKWFRQGITAACDSARPDCIQELREIGVVAIGVSKGKIQDGITKVRNRIKPAFGEPKLVASGKNCKQFIRDMRLYHYKVKNGTIQSENPEKSNSDGPDAIRYFIVANIQRCVVDKVYIT